MVAEAVRFVVAGDLDRPTGGNIYDRRMIDALRGRGWDVAVLSLPGRFPDAGDAVSHGERLFEGLPEGSVVVIDGLVLADLAGVVQGQRDRLRMVAIIHYALAEAKGLAQPLRDRLCAQERAGWEAVTRIVVTSPYMARLLGDEGVGADKIGMVVPGVDGAPARRGSGKTGAGSRRPDSHKLDSHRLDSHRLDSGTAQLLCVASVTEHKGAFVLVRALARLKHMAWRLVWVGSLTHEPVTVAALQREIADLGLAERIDLTGEIRHEDLSAFYDRADVFVLASFHEAYGMAAAEALAYGLPIVGTAAGAMAELVPESAGMLVPPGDDGALAEALGGVIGDQALRSRLREGARRAGRKLGDWQMAGQLFEAQIRRVLAP